jgi:hypothetical protein
MYIEALFLFLDALFFLMLSASFYILLNLIFLFEECDIVLVGFVVADVEFV